MAITFELTDQLLSPVLERLVGDGAAVSEFSVTALKPGAGNPTSLGVYRVRGVTQAGEDFSLVVKHLATGLPMMDASQPEFWNYWKREIDFFESPLAGRIPASLGYPKYLGQSLLPDSSVLFWNSDLGDLEKFNWSWEQCLDAARIAAELNSIDSSDEADYPWLNRTQYEGWLDFKDLWFTPMHPQVIELAGLRPDTAAALEVFGPFMPQQERLVRVMKERRQVFVHGDYNLNNLVPMPGSNPSVIALDWQLCGMGAVGAEVASIFNTAHELGFILASDAHFEEICLEYQEAFNRFQPDSPVGLDEVRLAAAAIGYTIVLGVGVFYARSEDGDTAEVNRAKVQNMVDDFATGPLMTYSRVLHELIGA